MKNLFIFLIFTLSIFTLHEGFSYMPKNNTYIASTNTNPRGQKRPHDGRGSTKFGKEHAKNQNKCQNPNKGPGYGRGNAQGNGQYRK